SAESEERTDILDLSDFQLGIFPTDLTSRSDEFDAQKKPAGAGDQEGASDSNYHVFLDDLAVPPGPVVASSSVMIGMSSVFSDLDYAPASSPLRGTGQAKDEDPLLATPEPDRSGIADLANLAGDSDVLLVSPDSPTGGPVDSDVQLIADDSSSSDSWEVQAEPLATTDGSSSSQEIEAFEPESGAKHKPSDDRNFESSGPFMVSGLGSQDDLGAIQDILPSESDVMIARQDVAAGGFSQSIDSGLSPEPPSGLDLGLDSIIGLAPLPEEETSPRPPSTKRPLAGPEELKKAPAAQKPAPAAQTPTPAAQTPTPAASRFDEDFNSESDFDLSLSAIVRDQDDPTALVDEQSDFELDQVDSGSEVFAIEEEEGVDQNAATLTTTPAEFDEDEDDETELPVVSAPTQTAGARDTLSTIASELLTSQPGREHRRVRLPSLMTASSDLEYSGLTIGLLSMAVLLMLFAAFVVNDLAHYEGFQQDSWTGSGLIRQLAGLFGG
ncbi:MAG TPA: hypothetical protein VJY33_06645, partial [Isosphaeraceae bacterium]|nr:hypothetical protein [Isosphaeraceae bacterium]